jgi:hypothetical protein
MGGGPGFTHQLGVSGCSRRVPRNRRSGAPSVSMEPTAGRIVESGVDPHFFSGDFLDRDLRKLPSRSLEPHRQSPHVIRQLRQYGRCPSGAALGLQCPHPPAEVGAVLAEEARRPMGPPALREALARRGRRKTNISTASMGPPALREAIARASAYISQVPTDQ